MIYLPNKGECGRILICFLPNEESVRGAQANSGHYHSLGELARSQANQAETSIYYPSGNLFLYEGDVLPISCNMIGRVVNCASAEGVSDSIGGGGSQAGSKESDGGTARWIGDQLWQN